MASWNAAGAQDTFVDVGAIAVETPAKTITLAPADRYSSIEYSNSPSEWSDGDRIAIRGEGSRQFPPFVAGVRSASAIEVTWTGDPQQYVAVVLYVSDQGPGQFPHVRHAHCRGKGGSLSIPAAGVDFIADTPWEPTFRRWIAVAETEHEVETSRGRVVLLSRTPFIDAALAAWTPIDVR